MWRRSLDLAGPMLFVAGLLLFAFAYGFFAAREQLFPYRFMNTAEEAARAFWRVNVAGETRARTVYTAPARTDATGAVVHDRTRVQDGVTLIVGYKPGGFRAWLVDLDGGILHEWQARFDDVFPERPHLFWTVGGEIVGWHGVHLDPNGDLLLNFQGQGSFPYASGLVKLDRDSRVVWKLARNTHHDVSVAEDGTVWVPSLRYHAEAQERFPTLRPWYYEDTVLKVSPDGEVLDEISVLEALADFPGALTASHREQLGIGSTDPFHLNNVEPLPAAIADRFPLFAAGDLLISLRDTNTLAVIDSTTRRAKWLLADTVVRQHDPDFLPNGHLLIFDNRGGDPACGGSRLVELEPVRQTVVWAYDGCGGQPFWTEVRGMLQALPNGNVLVAETGGGRVLEVTRDHPGRVVWEYHNHLGMLDGEARVGMITHAERFSREDLPFLAARPR